MPKRSLSLAILCLAVSIGQELRSSSQPACTVLPNQFLQLLRPFVSSSTEFDKSFAQSFAIAEFRTISSSAEASRKLLSLLASYEDIKEETASALLANELLLEKLKKSKDDRQFKEFVDAALVADNAVLLEEIVALKDQTEKERASRAEADRQREHLEIRLQEERDGFSKAKTDMDSRVSDVTDKLKTVQADSTDAIEKLQRDVTSANQRASGYEDRLNRIASLLSVLGALVCAIVSVLGSEYLIREFQWEWLLRHPNSYGLRAIAYVAMTSFFGGLFRPKWRKYLWWGSVGFVALFIVLISLLGGPV